VIMREMKNFFKRKPLFLIDDHSKTWYKKKQCLRRPV
jgi:hypothetical protein